MPLPTPNKNEQQDAFISRCMSNPTMKKEFPESKQRQGVCFSQWKKKKESVVIREGTVVQVKNGNQNIRLTEDQ